MKLFDTHLRTLKAKDRPFRLSDGNGLYLEVRPANSRNPNGLRLWRYRYRIGPTENLFALGAYPTMSLNAAREARTAARELVKKGIHPSHQRKHDKIARQFEHANTFEAVAREWMKMHSEHPRAPWNANTYRQRKNLLENEVFPHIGALPMRQVTPAHAHAVVARIGKRAPTMAVIARQCFGSISLLAITTLRAETDLGFVLRHSVRVNETTHKTPLDPHEIPAFFKALDKFPGSPMTKSAIRLLWLTLVRPNEIIRARWEHFDLEQATWSIPFSSMKMRQPHRVPLPRQALEILEALKPFTFATGQLLPNRNDPTRPASLGIINKALNSMGYEGKFSAHGIRVTGRTVLGEQGHPRDVLDRQIAHRESKNQRAYDQGDRLEARRKIMQGWADYLDGLNRGAVVTNIEGKRAKATT